VKYRVSGTIKYLFIVRTADQLVEADNEDDALDQVHEEHCPIGTGDYTVDWYGDNLSAVLVAGEAPEGEDVRLRREGYPVLPGLDALL
jgi:hypothetical protein